MDLNFLTLRTPLICTSQSQYVPHSRTGIARKLHAESLESRFLLTAAPHFPVLDLQSTSGVVFDDLTGRVSGWLDQSTNDNDLRPAFENLESELPTYGSVQTPSGVEAVRFDGIDDRLLRDLTDAPAIGLPRNDRARTTFMVVQFHDAAAFGGVAYGAGRFNQAFEIGVSGPGDQLGSLAVQGWGVGNDFESDFQAFTNPGTTAGWMVVTAVHEQDGSDPADNNFLFVNGAEVAAWDQRYVTKNDRTDDLNGNTQSRMVVGQGISEEGYVQMDLAAWLVYDTVLTESERLDVENFLITTYLANSSNTPPTAVDDSVDIEAGGAVTIDVLANDTDVDSSILPSSVTIVSPPTASQSYGVDPSTGAIFYEHDGTLLSDSLTYTVRDTSGAFSNTATVSISVSPANLAPEINQFQSSTTSGDSPLEVVFAAQVSDLENDALIYELIYGDGSSTGLLDVSVDGLISHIHTYATDGIFDVVLKVYDSGNETVSDPLSITVGSLDELTVTAGLVTWLETGDGSGTVTIATDRTVSAWKDSSPNGSDLVASGDPQLIGNATPSGQPAIAFDGDGDKLQRIGSLGDLPGGSVDRTVLVLAKHHDPQGVFAGLSYGKGGHNRAFSVGVDGVTENFSVEGWRSANQYNSSVPGVGQDWQLQSVVLSNDQLNHYANGVLIDSQSHVFNTRLDAPKSRIVLGEEISGLGFSQIDVAAALVYDRALSDAERASVEDYLWNKYLQTPAPSPIANDDQVELTLGATISVDVLINDTHPDGVVDPATVVIVDQPSYAASLSFDPATGVVTYENNGESLPDSFSYTVQDEAGLVSNVATVTIEAANVGPTASNDERTVALGGSLVIDVLSNDTDSDGMLDPATVAIVDAPEYAQGISIDPVTGAISYQHDGTTLPDSFTYTVADNDGAVSNAASVTIAQINRAPSAVDDMVELALGDTADINILANDSDLEGALDPITVMIVNPPQYAASFFVDQVTGVVTYEHDGQTLPDSFSYTVQDLQGEVSNVATVTIDVPNVAPIAGNDTSSFVLGEFLLIDVLANDSDTDGTLDPSTVTILDTPAHALSLGIDPVTGEITYRNDGSALSDSFTYTVADNDGATSNLATVSIDRIFLPPTATDDTVAISLGESISINVLDNDSDQDGSVDPTTVVIVDQPQNASSVAVDPLTGEILYSHDGMSLPDSFTYQFTDNDGQLSNLATVTVELAVIAPTAVHDIAYVAKDSAVLIDVLFNDEPTERPLDPQSVRIVDGPLFASSLSIDPVTGAITYVHDGSTLPDTFTYTVQDTAGIESELATVTVRDLTFPPFASSLSLHLQSDVGVRLDGSLAVSEWTDASSFGNTVFATGDPQLVAVATPSGAPAIYFDGEGDKLERVNATSGLSGLPEDAQNRSVFAIVNYVDSQGYPGGISYGKAGSNRAFALVSDPEAETLAIYGWKSTNDLVSTEPGAGAGWLLQSAVLNDNQLEHFANGVLVDSWNHVYQTRLDAPASKIVLGESIFADGQSELAVAAYLVYDRALDESERVEVEAYLSTKYLQAVVAPTATDDYVGILSGDSVQIDVLANDFDADSSIDRSTIEIVDLPAHAADLSIDAVTGMITYVHDGEQLPDKFTYRVLDVGGAASNTATVHITPPNASPQASDDTVGLFLGGELQIDVLANDIDTDGTLAPAYLEIVVPPSHGNLIIDAASGVITYQNDGSVLPDSFSYTVADNAGAISNVATVVLERINQAPRATNDLVQIEFGGTVEIDVLANDFDADGSLNLSTLAIVDMPENAVSVSIDPLSGKITYAHDGTALPDTFTYTVQDQQGQISNTATVTIEKAFEERDIYFVGNSLTGGLRLDGGFRPLANENRYGWSDQFADTDTYTQLVPGASLSWHWYQKGSSDGLGQFYIDEFTPELINNTWDTLVLQPFNRAPEFFRTNPLPDEPKFETWQEPPREEGSIAMSNNFINLAAHNPNLQVVIYQVWPTTPAISGTSLPDFDQFDYKAEWDSQTSSGMRTRSQFETLIEALRDEWDSALQPEIIMTPTGDVLYELNERLRAEPFVDIDGQVYDDIEDFYSDRVHLKAGIGRYLMALTMYSVLYQEDPRGVSVGNYNDITIYNSGFQASFVAVSPSMQAMLQDVVWDVVSTHPYSGWTTAGASTEMDLNIEAGVSTDQVSALLASEPVLLDFELDGDVDGSDFVAWQHNYDQSETTVTGENDSGDATVDADDLAFWRSSYRQGQSRSSYSRVNPDASVLGTQQRTDSSETGIVDAAFALAVVEEEPDQQTEIEVASAMTERMRYASITVQPEMQSIHSTQASSSKIDKQFDTEELDDSWISEELLERVLS